MTNGEKYRVMRDIDNEGFDETFRTYDDYRDIADDEFHRLRRIYLRAQEAFAKYIGLRLRFPQ